MWITHLELSMICKNSAQWVQKRLQNIKEDYILKRKSLWRFKRNWAQWFKKAWLQQLSSSAVMLVILTIPVKRIRSLFTQNFPNDTRRYEASLKPLILPSNLEESNMIWRKKSDSFPRLIGVVKRFQMLEGKDGSVDRVERSWSKAEIKALHHVILKFIFLIMSLHCSSQLQWDWGWQRAALGYYTYF